MTVAQAPAAQTFDSPEDEMAAHLAVIRADRQGPAEDPVPAATTSNEPAPAAATPAAAPAPAADGATAGQADPAPAAATDKAATTPAASAPTASAAPTPSPLEEAQEKVRKAEAELHRLTSEIGRIGPLNAALQEQRRRNGELQAQLDAARAAPATKEEARTRLAALADSVQGFPELVSVIKVVDDALKESDQRAEATAKSVAAAAVEPLQAVRRQHEETATREAQQAYAEALTTFNETYPTANEVCQTPAFRQWIATAPAQIRTAFLKGETPQEALPVMDAYDAHLRRTGQPSIARTPTPVQSTTAAPATASAPAPAPQKDPQARLRQAAGIPSRQTGSAGAMPAADDFEGSLQFFREKRLRQAAATA